MKNYHTHLRLSLLLIACLCTLCISAQSSKSAQSRHTVVRKTARKGQAVSKKATTQRPVTQRDIGQKTVERMNKSNALVVQVCGGETNTPPEEKVYDVVEIQPSFPGGHSALMSWLAANIRYPQEAYNNSIQGRVVVTFIVEADGSITDAKVIRSVAPQLDKEALRVVNAMPKWTPGLQNGKAVRTKYNLPVTFKL